MVARSFHTYSFHILFIFLLFLSYYFHIPFIFLSYSLDILSHIPIIFFSFSFNILSYSFHILSHFKLIDTVLDNNDTDVQETWLRFDICVLLHLLVASIAVYLTTMTMTYRSYKITFAIERSSSSVSMKGAARYHFIQSFMFNYIGPELFNIFLHFTFKILISKYFSVQDRKGGALQRSRTRR